MADWRVLIADDEELARERLRTLLHGDPEFTVVGEASDGEEALALVDRLNPDIVLLDMDMPVLDGLGVVERMASSRPTAVVFVTAYDEFAVRAFEENAVDYLLKPVARERLRTALSRARMRLEAAEGAEIAPRILARLVESTPRAPAYRERLTVRNGSHFIVIRTSAITRAEAADNYVRLFAAGQSYMLRTRMRDLETLLDPARFVRVHRSVIINADFVDRIESWGLGEFLFVLKDGAKVSSSRRYREPIRDAFGV